MTPEEIAHQLEDIRRALPKLTEEIHDAEERATRASRHLDNAEATAYLNAQGTVKERESATTLAVLQLVAARDDALAHVRYLKMRRADLEMMQTNLQTTARLMLGGAA